MSYLEQLPQSPRYIVTQIDEDKAGLRGELKNRGYWAISVHMIVLHDTGEEMGNIEVWGCAGLPKTVEIINFRDGIMGARDGARGIIEKIMG